MGKVNLPRIIVDTREKKPLAFGLLPIMVKKLEFGDYSLRGFENRICVERKSLMDLWGTVSQESNLRRFNAELARAQAFGCRLHVVIETTPDKVFKPSRYCVMNPARVLDRLWEACHIWGAAATFAGNKEGATVVTLAILRGAWRGESK